MWDELRDPQLFGPDLIKESEEKVKLIRDRLKVAQSRQKSYADSKRKEVVYEIRTGRIWECHHFKELSVLELKES